MIVFVPFIVGIVVTSTFSISCLLKRKFNKKRRHSLIKRNGKRKSEDMCIICHENYLSNTHVATMYCNHSYHQDCLEEWLLNREACPLCNIDNNSKIVSNITKK